MSHPGLPYYMFTTTTKSYRVQQQAPPLVAMGYT
ncbi:hypothetical protein SNOG_02711 [Parastagonospora nodorum SN15]|uniref:Uncharacterized protein n=1 Tax=Phaeosphaeria nodorum (strain SN15 / ATCC MYA-4574 / FGSC 10173) TaxID=321614 RepID=Q0UZV3_PHANO|nr:hypothetical protein SNOG_02711 [Parastagonospora nodorum SN15]EAT89442.1 hypothetical protein SNOG_02711 [Parastagonospora nodorum SN15]